MDITSGIPGLEVGDACYALGVIALPQWYRARLGSRRINAPVPSARPTT